MSSDEWILMFAESSGGISTGGQEPPVTSSYWMDENGDIWIDESADGWSDE